MSSQTQLPTKSASHAQARRPAPSKLRWWRFPVILAVVVAASGGIWYSGWGHKAKASGTEQDPRRKPHEAEAVQVQVVRPERRKMELISSMHGSVRPYESADLFANVSGYLKSQEVTINGKTVSVDIGVHVKKGDVLAVIDVPEIHAEAEKAAADLAQAKAQAKQAAASVETAVADAKAAVAAIRQAEAEVIRYTAQKNETYKAYRRYSQLNTLSAVEKDVVDQKQDAYESAVSAEKASEANVEAARAKSIAAKARIDQAKADLVAAEANIGVADAKLKKANVYVGYTTIRSPYTGVITHRRYFPGDFIRSASEGNNQPMLTVARTDVVRVVTKIDDRNIPYADVGDPAVITLDALPGVRLHGKVARFSEAEDPAERTMQTEIDLANDESSPARGRLRPGMYGYAYINLNPPTEHFSIPASALVGDAKGDEGHVLVLRDGRARLISVVIGVDNGVRFVVLDGLKESDQVIIPNGAVVDGTPVVASATLAAQGKASSH